MQGDGGDDGFLFRHFDPAVDVPALARLLRAGEIVDWEGTQTTEEELREQLTWRGHDPARDRWVVESGGSPGSLAGYGGVWFQTPEYADLFIATHPSYRRRGIGTALLERLLDRARDQGISRVGAYANSLNAPAGAFLHGHGFDAVASYWDLTAPADLAIPEAAWPADLSLRTYREVADPRLLVDALNRSYAGLWGHGLATEQDVREWLETADPEGILFLMDEGGVPAGICRFHVDEESERGGVGGGPTRAGYIDAPGLVPEHRAASLYGSLVAEALRRLWRDDRFPVRMESWGDDPRTVDLYREMGFAATRHEILFGRNLPAG